MYKKLPAIYMYNYLNEQLLHRAKEIWQMASIKLSRVKNQILSSMENNHCHQQLCKVLPNSSCM